MGKGIRASKPYLGYILYKVWHKKQGRWFACLVSSTHRTTVAFAKYLVEVKVGKRLGRAVNVHHKDEDKKRDVLKNLEVKSASDHSRDHQVARGRTIIKGFCSMCRKFYVLRAAHGKRTQTFRCCSPRCRGDSRKKGAVMVPCREKIIRLVPE